MTSDMSQIADAITVQFDYNNGTLIYTCAANSLSDTIIDLGIYTSRNLLTLTENTYPVYSLDDVYIGHVLNDVYFGAEQTKIINVPLLETSNRRIINKIRQIKLSPASNSLTFKFNWESGATALVNDTELRVLSPIVEFRNTPFVFGGAYYLYSNWYPVFDANNNYTGYCTSSGFREKR